MGKRKGHHNSFFHKGHKKLKPEEDTTESSNVEEVANIPDPALSVYKNV